jgi:hypothetical protein
MFNICVMMNRCGLRALQYVTNLCCRDWRPLRTPEPLATRFDGAVFYWKFSTRYKDIDDNKMVAIGTSISNLSDIGTAACSWPLRVVADRGIGVATRFNQSPAYIKFYPRSAPLDRIL